MIQYTKLNIGDLQCLSISYWINSMTKIKNYFKIIILICSFISALLYLIKEPQQQQSPQKKPAKLNERYYQTKLCTKLNGVVEYRLKDKTRVDCLTSEYAIEVDWAKKWAEGIGQSLYYAEMTNKKPAVGLIIGENDFKYLKRLKRIADKYDIKIYKIEKE